MSIPIASPLDVVREIAPEAVSAADYTFVAADAGKMKLKASGDTAARAWTLDTSVLQAGDVISGINNASAGNITLTQGSGITLKLAGSASTGNRTVPPNATFHVWMETSSIGWVTGVGIS